jgi:hypothetical protein
MEAYKFLEEPSFSMSTNKFFEFLEKLVATSSQEMNLSSIEEMVQTEGRELLRTVLEEHIKQTGSGDVGSKLKGSDGVERTNLRERERKIKSIFGEIQVERTIYSASGSESLAPKEAILNLPKKCYSHGLAKRLAVEAAKGSFEEAIIAVKNSTGVEVPKRQAEEIVKEAAQDFQSFYEQRQPLAQEAASQGELIVLTTDGKGVVVRQDDLRESTKKRAEKDKKLNKRLSKGEKRNAKRMAQVASVYGIDRYERTGKQLLLGEKGSRVPKPVAKRVWASLEREQASVIAEIFDEAQKRDPTQDKDWVILVDGQSYQLDRIEKELTTRRISATIVVDLIHVIEYLWKASRDFYVEGSKEGEEWVNRYLLMLLEGKAKLVASAIRRSATRQNIGKRSGIEKCANYLHTYAPYLNYQDYLKRGLPIATGVIEGACRYIVKDRMEITGARWSLSGAEAILRLRSIYASGDWEEYWKYHERQAYERNHRSRYAHPEQLETPKLRLIK